MGEQNQVTTNEIMDFLKTNMVVKEEFLGLESKVDSLELKVDGLKSEVGGLKSEVGGLKSEVGVLRTEMESGFSRIDLELRAIKDVLKNLERRTKEDADVTSEEVINLCRRVENLEKQFKQMQTA